MFFPVFLPPFLPIWPLSHFKFYMFFTFFFFFSGVSRLIVLAVVIFVVRFFLLLLSGALPLRTLEKSTKESNCFIFGWSFSVVFFSEILVCLFWDWWEWFCPEALLISFSWNLFSRCGGILCCLLFVLVAVVVWTDTFFWSQFSCRSQFDSIFISVFVPFFGDLAALLVFGFHLLLLFFVFFLLCLLVFLYFYFACFLCFFFSCGFFLWVFLGVLCNVGQMGFIYFALLWSLGCFSSCTWGPTRRVLLQIRHV